MSSELSPERESELIEEISQFIVRHSFEDWAEMFLQASGPYGGVIGEYGFMALYPVAVALMGNSGKDLSNLLGFNYKQSAERILARIEELKAERQILLKNFKEDERDRRKREGRFPFLRRFGIGGRGKGSSTVGT